MNAIQFWLTDTILKVQELTTTATTVAAAKSTKNAAAETKLMLQHPQPPIKSVNNNMKKLPPSYFSTPTIFAVLVEQTERTPLLFPPSKHRMSS